MIGNTLKLDLNYLISSAKVNISLYDLKGARIATLFDKSCNRGIYKIQISNYSHSNGVYVLKILIGQENLVNTIIMNHSNKMAGNWQLETGNWKLF